MKKIQWNKGNARLTFTGKVDFKEIHEAGNVFYGDKRLEDINYILIDFRQADFSNLTEKDAESIAVFDSIASTYKPELKMAFLIYNELQELICNAYIQYSKTLFDTWRYMIFQDLSAAKEWCEASFD